MSDIRVISQQTPNPNAKKFITNRDVIEDGKVTFKDPNESKHVPLAAALMNLANVTQVHFFENVLTITQSGDSDWSELEAQIESTLKEMLNDHDPQVKSGESVRRESLPEDVRQIEEILDTHIRPYLQGDGGDLEIINYSKDQKVLSIRYEGACGTCPSSMYGTLNAIQGVLQDEFSSEIEVVAI
jgi:Fe-S cluster biogenesis protein NfuA